MSSTVLALRQLLQQRFPDAAPLTERSNAVATGLGEVDAALPGGGLPRGRLTAWAPGGGATAVLRAACLTTVAAGERALWVDAAGTAGADWEEGPLLLRPTSPLGAVRGAEAVLRSMAFALVVVAGADPQGTEGTEGTARLRLTRAAREGGTALVLLSGAPALATLRVASRILPHSYRWRRGPLGDLAAPVAATVEVRARTMGWNRAGRVTLRVAACDVRLPVGPGVAGLADRRGARR